MVTELAMAQGPGKISGRVFDVDTEEGIGFTTVVVLGGNDSVVGGVLSDEDGKFSVQGLPMGRLRLKVESLGYAQLISEPVTLTTGNPSLNGVDLKLSPNIKIDAVEITATQDFTQNKIDRKVYAVERNIVSQGGSASDVLNTVPSVEVDMDGQLNLRGNPNVTVFIDGKPSTLTGSSRAAILDQLPASAIKSIEVITHPSAKYDPDGTAGIINIVTKKEAREGLNGNISLGVGTNNKYNGSASLNWRKKKFNAFGSYSFRAEERWNEGLSDTYTASDSVTPWQYEVSDGTRGSIENVFKVGTDFYLSEKTTLGVVGTGSLTQRNAEDVSDFIEANALEVPQFRYLRGADEQSPRRAFEGEVNLQHRPGKPGRQLDARAALSRTYSEDNERYYSDSLTLAGDSRGLPQARQNQSTLENFVLGTAQVDYSTPLGEKARLEAGLKSTLRDIQSDFSYSAFMPDQQAFVVDTGLSNSFRYQEQVHAGYLIYGRSMGKLGVEAGLRAEQALTGFTLYNTDSTYTNNYFQLFPSAHLAYTLNESSEWRIGYSRRINRPETGNLNPFTEYSNPKRLRRGNPTLQPEYINAIELSHLWRFKPGSLSTTLYYRRLSNTVSRIIEPLGGDTVQTTFVNLLDGHAYGLELIGQLRPTKWLETTLSANLFRTVMDASNVSANLNLVNLGVDGRFLATANITKKLSFQYTFNYQPPRVGPQGRIEARYSMDAALKQNLLKNKASLSLRVSDLMNTMEFRIYTEEEGLISDSYRKRETRIAFLTFAYRFGQEGKAERRQRKEEEQDRNSGFDF